MEIVAKLALAIVTAVVAFTGGFLVGDSKNLNPAEAELVSRASYDKAYANSKASARREARERAYPTAKTKFARRGSALGRARGHRAGVEERKENEKPKQSSYTQPRNYYCESDGYCVERANPDPAGPTCPPGTTPNAQGVVCVPNQLIE